jgi:hypothetical protein
MKTANEFLETENFNNTTDLMIDFAKMHVAEALKQVSESAIIVNTEWSFEYGSYGNEIPSNIIIDEESILNAYPLENIV